ncbi:MAG: hypothetical protein V1726_03590 [Methanobacteriota archaeon]
MKIKIGAVFILLAFLSIVIAFPFIQQWCTIGDPDDVDGDPDDVETKATSQDRGYPGNGDGGDPDEVYIMSPPLARNQRSGMPDEVDGDPDDYD